ncbi:MAG: hypothetical protein CFH41_02448 [Alphaproteobacteria bacterium MarineAlpha11_Bin1]|nr:MAG: hypothetical protein CFH41_02448 [Alphaproteobacteria bacterium MarineAlpha11_Bin1]|tara:strand:- start:665 stop:796 length:132 start_codon:yes stop_codon:yes gene_type:complete
MPLKIKTTCNGFVAEVSGLDLLEAINPEFCMEIETAIEDPDKK